MEPANENGVNVFRAVPQCVNSLDTNTRLYRITIVVMNIMYYLDSKRVSILIEAVWPTLPMLYLPFNVYIDSKRE